jgi:ABC-type glutathione transport system ATPase component
VTTTPLVEIDRLGKRFRLPSGQAVTALADVSLSIGAGEIVGLVGESGSGKSTLANVVLGLVDADDGRVSFAGRALAAWLREEPRAYRRQVQAVFQQPALALDPLRTIGWSVIEPLTIHRLCRRAERSRRATELLAKVGLDDDLTVRRPAELSGGQLQRVNIARALALEPRLLVCDEAVSSLDVSVQAQILNLLLDIHLRDGLAMLFISHDIAVVRHIADQVVVLLDGRVVEAGPVDEVVDHPQQEYTQRLVAASEARA